MTTVWCSSRTLPARQCRLHTYLSDFRPKQPLYLYGKSQALIGREPVLGGASRPSSILKSPLNLEKLPEAANRDTKLVFARDLSLDELGGRNLIFIGADEGEPLGGALSTFDELYSGE